MLTVMQKNDNTVIVEY